jgi:HSP20 family protein
MDRLFEESFIQPRFVAPLRESFTGRLPVDVVENPNELIVKASIPGMKPEDIEITVVGDSLTIKGTAQSEVKQEKENFVVQERHFGSFRRTLNLPVAVQADKAHADFENGVLTLTLPKVEEIKPKQIKVVARNGAK